MQPPKPDSLAGQALKYGVRTALRMPRGLASRIFGEAPTKMQSIREITFTGPASELAARVYRPREGRLPGCVFFHGGGFVIGSHDSYEGFCTALAKRADCVVISVDYRLAPERPFPAAIADCCAAFEAVLKRADELGVIRDSVAVAGDSAGGNLATVVCQQQVEQGRPLPTYQLLIYPKTDYGDAYRSRRLFAEGFLLTGSMIDWFRQCYGADDDDPRCSPARFGRLSALPPATVITAGFDPLRDEGEAYAEKLSQAGVDVHHHCCDQLIHGFRTQGGIVDAAAAAIADLAEEFAQHLRAERSDLSQGS
jgi:acetyl esterase